MMKFKGLIILLFVIVLSIILFFIRHEDKKEIETEGQKITRLSNER